MKKRPEAYYLNSKRYFQQGNSWLHFSGNHSTMYHSANKLGIIIKKGAYSCIRVVEIASKTVVQTFVLKRVVASHMKDKIVQMEFRTDFHSLFSGLGLTDSNKPIDHLLLSTKGERSAVRACRQSIFCKFSSGKICF